MRREAGVTLIELIVTLVIAAIMLTLGVSGMTALVKRNACTNEVNTLIANLNFARAAAVLRGTEVTVCPIDPDNLPAEPADPCVSIKASDGDRQWQQGYIVFVTGTGVRLRIQPPSIGVTIESTVPWFRFMDNGSVSTFVVSRAPSGGTVRICDLADNADSDDDRASRVAAPRAVVVSGVGRIRVDDHDGDEDIDCSGDPPS